MKSLAEAWNDALIWYLWLRYYSKYNEGLMSRWISHELWEQKSYVLVLFPTSLPREIEQDAQVRHVWLHIGCHHRVSFGWMIHQNAQIWWSKCEKKTKKLYKRYYVNYNNLHIIYKFLKQHFAQVQKFQIKGSSQTFMQWLCSLYMLYFFFLSSWNLLNSFMLLPGVR